MQMSDPIDADAIVEAEQMPSDRHFDPATSNISDSASPATLDAINPSPTPNSMISAQTLEEKEARESNDATKPTHQEPHIPTSLSLSGDLEISQVSTQSITNSNSNSNSNASPSHPPHSPTANRSATQPLVQSNAEQISMDGQGKKRMRVVSESLKATIEIYLRIIIQNIPLILATLAIGFAYYYPAYFMTDKERQDLRNGMYKSVSPALLFNSSFGMLILLGIEIFSWRFIRRPLLILCLPLYLLCYVIEYILPLDDTVASFAWLLVINITPILALWMVRRSPFPSVDSADSRTMFYYAVTQDGTPMALILGSAALFFFMGLSSASVPMYLYMEPNTQIFVRVIILPILIITVVSYQNIVLMGLPDSNSAPRNLLVVGTSQYIQFIGRVLVSNVSSGTRSAQYILVNCCMMFVEVINRVMFIKRQTLLKDIRRKIVACLPKRFVQIFLKRGTPRGLYDGPHPDTEMQPLDIYAPLSSRASVHSDALSLGSTVSSNYSLPSTSTLASTAESRSDLLPVTGDGQDFDPNPSKRKRARRIQRARIARARLLADDIGTEIRVLCFVPVMLYLFHPIYPDSRFNTISNIGEVFYQIAVQMVFEILSDLTSLFIEIHYLAIPIRPKDVPLRSNFIIVKMSMCFMCLVSMEWLVATYINE